MKHETKMIHDPRFMIHKKGFTLIELLITIAVLGVLSVGLWSAWVMGLQITSEKRAEVSALSLANEKIEAVKALDYDSIGTINGIPRGTLPQTEAVTRNAITYTVTTAALYVDDPFDGVAPTDTLPIDYKRIRVAVQWAGKFGVAPVVLMTDVAPKGIETNLDGGTIRITVLDAQNNPVANATVALQNTRVTPPINLALTTNDAGQLLIPGSPISQEGYDVTITKDGYSQDRTIRADAQTNPAPTRPPLSVFQNQLTDAVFFIDRTAMLTVTTVDDRGSPLWWQSASLYRKNITIENNAASDGPAATPIFLDLDHRALVQEGKSLANGNDIRVVFFNGTYFEELDRVNTTAWNSATKTRIWFQTKRSIERNDEDEGYALYYGNPDTQAPLASPSRVFPPTASEDTVGLWYFNEGTGSTVARDASGYSHDGTLTDMDPQTAWVEGKFGTALAFNGSTAPFPHIRIAGTLALSTMDQVTVEAWVYPTFRGNDQAIVSKIDSSKLVGTYHLYQDYDSFCLFVWKSPNPYDGKGCGGPVVFNAWNHVAGTFDGRYIRIYVNGVLAGTAEKPGILSKTVWVELNIGRYAGHNWEPYRGRIDTVAIHKSARSDFAYGAPTNLTTELSSERNYQQPNAIANVPFTLTSNRTIGATETGTPIPKYTAALRTNAQGVLTLPTMEWGLYALTIDGTASGYDIAATRPLLPINLLPGATTQERLTLLAHRTHTLLVIVKNKHVSLDGATVRLTGVDHSYDKTIITGETGQAFFSPLTGDALYTLTVTKPGYTQSTTTTHVNNQSYEDVALSPL